jgi:purine-binding chemotaxis protein CheW
MSGQRAREIDWADLRRRLDAARENAANAMAMTPDETHSLLAERARVLAQAPVPPAENTIEVVTFTLAGELYAIESAYVVEALRLTELARLPGAVAPLFGLTVWRGELLSLLDLRPLLGLSAGALNDLVRVIVLGQRRAQFGILVDALRGMRELSPGEVQPPAHGVGSERALVTGITSNAAQLLDAEALLRLHA